jgi:hypothetical protein
MRIKRWNDFLSYIKESKSTEELGFWKIDEDDIRDYFQESIDEGYQIEVRFGFVGEERTWSHKEQKSYYLERFTKKMLSGKNTPAISILITSEKVSSNDVSDNLRFAHSIISEEADAEISILDADGEIGEIDGIVAKGGLFYTDTWNENPEVQEVEGHVEFLVKQNEYVNITQKQLAEYYNWGSYEEKGDLIFVDYSLEDLADEILSRDSNYKDLLINGDDGSIYENYWSSDYQPDFNSLFDYYLDKENKSLFVKTLIKDAGGLEEFVSYIGDECDDMAYDAIKVMMEDKEGEPEATKEERKIKDITEYLLKERFYTLKQMSKDSEILSDIKESYGDWASNTHAEKNLEEIRSEFDSILNDNFTYKKATREVEKKRRDTSGNFHTYRDEETFYLIQFSSDWIEEIEFEDLENEKLTSVFETYLDKNDLYRHELNPHFSDYGDMDDKAWNKDIKSDLLRFLNK